MGLRFSLEATMELREVKKYFKTCSDEELRAFIHHCERQLDSADEDVRVAAGAALKLARGERGVRELWRGLHRHPDGGE